MLEISRGQVGALYVLALPFAIFIAFLTSLLFSRLSLSPLAFAIELIAGFLYQGFAFSVLRFEGEELGAHMRRSDISVLLTVAGVGAFAGLCIGVGFLLVLVPGMLVMTIWSVIVPVILVEGKGFAALERSRELIQGNGWSVFPVVFGVFLLGAGLDLGLNGVADIVGPSLWTRGISTAIAWLAVLPIGVVAAAAIYWLLQDANLKGELAPADLSLS